jgi:hypothetical protein
MAKSSGLTEWLAREVSRRGAEAQRRRGGIAASCDRSFDFRARNWRKRALLGKFPEPATAGQRPDPAKLRPAAFHCHFAVRGFLLAKRKWAGRHRNMHRP